MQTVPDTHSYHSFVPDEDSLIIKKISSDDVIKDVHKFNNHKLLRKPINKESTLHAIMTKFDTLE